ncbi:Pre-mRNA splicing factor [Macleaya cordata]|uniref:Pre-mRNA splicing factor n=1 Tax=Macleaya cordata TaxID=56857 RepID=A0A200QZA0_MACCD|nr:Pre-mRNA splicing factor [Macleaya cordata]
MAHRKPQKHREPCLGLGLVIPICIGNLTFFMFEINTRKQERLDFLYDSGLAVGKGSSDGFKALEALPKTESDPTTSSSSKPQASAPGALFEEKPQSANDAWRKLHSDPLLLIRQREQEALARIKNNPIQMAKIKESVKAKKKHGKHEEKEYKKKKKSTHSSSKDPLGTKGDGTSKGEESRERSHRSNSGHHHERPPKGRSDSENDSTERWERRKRSHHKSKHGRSDSEADSTERRERQKRSHYKSKRSRSDSEADSSERWERSKKRTIHDQKSSNHDQKKSSTETNRAINDTMTPTEADRRSRPRHKQRQTAVKLTEEEKAARLREMQMDAELHEEQRWKRLKKASEDDALEEKRASSSHKQHNFLDAAQKSVYGAEKGGSSTIEESVRRRTYFLQGRSEASETNAFRR